MRRYAFGLIPTIALVMAVGMSYAYAAKPQEVIQLSNGFPSGAHFNMNIHGKSSGDCDPTPGGGSVFVPLYGTATLTIVSNKRSSQAELTALDPCAEAFDGDPIRVQLPTQSQGYYVFARIGGKPRNADDGTASSIILTPNPVLRVCNDTTDGNPDFGTYTECPSGESGDTTLLALGLVTNEGAYDLDSQGFFRFDPDSAPGRGKQKGVDITGLFTWSGYVCDAALDVSGPDSVPDGVLNELDVPLAYDTNLTDGIQADELANWLADQELAGTCDAYASTWVFNVADLVEQDTEIENNGTKLLQVRFYPVATTSFTPGQ